MADLTRAEIEDYRKKHLLPRGFGNALNDLDHRICDMALKGVTYAAPEALQSARFDGIVDGAKREADRRALREAITDEDVERALEAANGAMVDTRRHWTSEDRAAVRAMLEAVSFPSPLARRQEEKP